MIYKAGITESDQIDASNILKPYLSRGDITIIGATTPKEYKETIAKDRALSRRLSPIWIKELDKPYVIEIINEFSKGRIKDDILDHIYERSKEIANMANPDISIEICDRCIARNKCTKKEITNEMVDDIVETMIGDYKSISNGN